ncbi:hypothetical protein CO172_01925 [Candidatus Uhrbacteria bacterium CG_4_9_14_3_um_filter_36_7]|uniref:Uncharacterized protein n=1 Tax=Candidatus Uhrbacteria bacterium CG_4_9_14_3_um_filter_36_7 TaxID=1975033 RepID=A0A2M7XHG9_9BACT|nr:MAG: hypothetical protein CO172_01925 [Candidatus Uhrbacteria bacterium CG_4_9_14_3_um_filter_36_7]
MQESSSFNREQKFALGLFFVIAIGTLVFGLRTFGAHVSRPFDLQRLSIANSSQETFLLSSEEAQKQREQQMQQDTDKDGLNDYEELSIYKTSPYLSDSDSDGYDDKTEIDSGNDPNCPVDKECTGASTSDLSQVTSLEDDLLPFTDEGMDLFSENVSGFSEDILADTTDDDMVGFSSIEEVNEFLASLDPEEIRALLLKQGIPQETLDQIDDTTLQTLFAQAVVEAQQQGTLDSLLIESKESEGS